MLALDEQRRRTHKCGSDLALSTDPEKAPRTNVHTEKCWVCAATEQYEREQRERHKEHNGWTDGRMFYPDPLTTDPSTDAGGD